MTVKTQTTSANVWELFLVRLRYKEGVLERKTQVMLNAPESAWLVYEGEVNLFTTPIEGGAWQPFQQIPHPGLMIGLQTQGYPIGLLAAAVPETKLLRIPLKNFIELAEDAEFAPLVTEAFNQWLHNTARGISRNMVIPKAYHAVETGKRLQLAPRDLLRPQKHICWVRIEAGQACFMGDAALAVEAGEVIPLTPSTWLTAETDCTLTILDTAALLSDKNLAPALARYHRLLLDTVAILNTRQHAFERERLQKQAVQDESRVEKVLYKLASTLSQGEAAATPITEQQDALFAACELVGRGQKIAFLRPNTPHSLTLPDILQASGVRSRQVALAGRWWEEDHGAMLAYTGEDRQPVALLPRSATRYDLINPLTQQKTPVDEQVAAGLHPLAMQFYRPLPPGKITPLQLFRFGITDVRAELRSLLLLSLGLAVLQLALPEATSMVFDSLIPQAARSTLVMMGFVLVGIALVSTIFQVAQLVAVQRMESKFDARVQPAIWDRLLELPTTFFRDYSAGDLGSRALSITQIRMLLSGTVIFAFLTLVSSLSSLFLLFIYNLQMAFVAVGMVALAFAVTIVIGLIQTRKQRQLAAIQGRISGYLLQFINGISKFRTAGVEERVFTFWAELFNQQRQLSYAVRRIQIRQVVFNTAYPVITTMIIFSMMANTQNMSVGNFLAFNVAFSQFLMAGLRMSSFAISALAIVPMVERLNPIIQAIPEANLQKAHPGELSGDIEVSHVSFRYGAGLPLVLYDVSFKIQRGEFVAIVGPSGSGKSSLMRLLLGFDRPEAGAILYDGVDLADLDIRAVRQQIGVVLQNNQLISGSDIFTNIVGSSATLTIDDAWEAARLVGLDDDLKRMPMGMHTVVSEGGGTLSGGQKQRILIARAIVRKPRMLFFDEATSALDNKNQAVVSESLERLDATRIVIAHRLSTIINADRIIVVQAGRVVQQGTYQDLLRQPGVFAELAQRQLV